MRKLLWLERYCNCWNEIETNVDSYFERKYSKYKIMYHKFIPKILKIYQTLIALSIYAIFYHSKMLKFWCKFRIDNFSIITTSKRCLFEELFLTGIAYQIIISAKKRYFKLYNFPGKKMLHMRTYFIYIFIYKICLCLYIIICNCK